MIICVLRGAARLLLSRSVFRPRVFASRSLVLVNTDVLLEPHGFKKWIHFR
jgi:hypothetical protein